VSDIAMNAGKQRYIAWTIHSRKSVMVRRRGCSQSRERCTFYPVLSIWYPHCPAVPYTVLGSLSMIFYKEYIQFKAWVYGMIE